MKCLNEHVARIGNVEDQTSGHFRVGGVHAPTDLSILEPS